MSFRMLVLIRARTRPFIQGIFLDFFDKRPPCVYTQVLCVILRKPTRSQGELLELGLLYVRGGSGLFARVRASGPGVCESCPFHPFCGRQLYCTNFHYYNLTLYRPASKPAGVCVP